MSDHDEIGTFFVGFIVGGLTGAIVTLLFAPQSGEETRTLIKDKSIELLDKARNSVEEKLNHIEEVAKVAHPRTKVEEPSGSGGGRPRGR